MVTNKLHGSTNLRRMYMKMVIWVSSPEKSCHQWRETAVCLISDFWLTAERMWWKSIRGKTKIPNFMMNLCSLTGWSCNFCCFKHSAPVFSLPPSSFPSTLFLSSACLCLHVCLFPFITFYPYLFLSPSSPFFPCLSSSNLSPTFFCFSLLCFFLCLSSTCLLPIAFPFPSFFLPLSSLSVFLFPVPVFDFPLSIFLFLSSAHQVLKYTST